MHDDGDTVQARPGRLGQCARDDRNHHLEESNAQPARRAIHQDHACGREAAGEVEIISTNEIKCGLSEAKRCEVIHRDLEVRSDEERDVA